MTQIEELPSENTKMVMDILKEQNRTLRKMKEKRTSANLVTDLLFSMGRMAKTREVEAIAIKRKRGLIIEKEPTKEEFFKDEMHRVSWEFLLTEEERNEKHEEKKQRILSITRKNSNR